METKTFKERQIDEAINRMKALKIMPSVIDDFKKNGKLYYSERLSKICDGILYWVDNDPKYVQLVKDFEKTSGCLVYHCQLTHTTMGDMFAMIYVSKYEEDWKFENKDLAYGIAYAKVINLDDPSLSDMGSIGVAPRNGGITRTA